MKTKYKYIEFVQTTLHGFWNCLNIKSRAELGSVSYYKAWGQYVFEPYELGDVIFSSDCLRDVAHFLDQLNKRKGGFETAKAPVASGRK